RRMNVAISRARRKVVLVGNRQTFVAPSTPEEEPAKEQYRRLFALLDAQAARGVACVLEPPRWRPTRERLTPFSGSRRRWRAPCPTARSGELAVTSGPARYWVCRPTSSKRLGWSGSSASAFRPARSTAAC